jgi:hypothetical protein
MIEPNPGEPGSPGWEAEVETVRMPPASLLSEPQPQEVEVTTNWAVFLGKARVEVTSNPRALRLVSSDPEPALP